MTDYRRVIEDDLNSILTDWPDLEAVTISGGCVTGGGNDQQLPGGTQRLNLIADAYTLFTVLCLRVLDEKDLTGGNVGEGGAERINFLLIHAEHLATVGPVQETADEIHDLAGSIRSLVAPSGVRRLPIGACPVLDCGGAVFATIKDDGDGTMPDLRCDVERDHVWPEGDYQRLAKMLGHDGPERMGVAELAEYLQTRWGRFIPEQTIRTWVRRSPISVGWDESTYTVDRVKATSHYLERRAARAKVA